MMKLEGTPLATYYRTHDDFMGICMIDSVTGWVCGDTGRLWRYPGLVGVEDVPEYIPKYTTLYQNYPNPFNPSSTIRYYLDEPSYITLKVYTVYGELVSTLLEGMQTPGEHEAVFSADNLPAGAYIYELTIDGTPQRKKMLLVK